MAFNKSHFSLRHKYTKMVLFVVTLSIVIAVLFTFILPNSSSAPDVRMRLVHGDGGGQNESRADSHLRRTRWIVVTSISHPTPQIAKLSQLPGWQLLVVADKRTPVNWAAPHDTLYLSTEDQSKLGYQIINHIPWNSYARKMVGYLYAIQHGARVIYDTDDDNAPDGDGSSFDGYFAVKGDAEMRGLVISRESGSRVKNPYVHFGQGTIWPRGYPLDEIGRNYTHTYTACRAKPPVIQQGLVSGDPDVDAIFRLTRNKAYAPLNIQFDSRAPPSIYPKGVLAPFNSQNTVFLYDAFWALTLPISVPSRVTDIWRGFWAQPLLWRTGNTLGFFPPHTTQQRNPHNYLRDFAEEVQLYTQTGRLIQLLHKWVCPGESLSVCMEELTLVLVGEGFLGREDVRLMVAWIQDLNNLGYKAPAFDADKVPRPSPCLPGVKRSEAMFHAVRPSVGLKGHDGILRFCNIGPDTEVKKDPDQHPSTLLVVTFNKPHLHDNVHLLDLLYRPVFPNTVYCGPTTNLTTDVLNLGKSFIPADTEEGVTVYECLLRAIDMGYDVDNYLTLSDDVLLNFWNLWDYDREQAWDFPIWPEAYSTDDCPEMIAGAGDPEVWKDPWLEPYACVAFKAAMAELSQLSTLEGGDWTQFMKIRETHGLSSTVANYGFSDIYYIPKSKQEIFYKIGWVLRKYNVFVDLAVAFLVSGLWDSGNYVRLNVSYLWNDDDRGKVWDKYDTHMDALHPVKVAGFANNVVSRRDWCNHYVLNAVQK